MIGRIVHVPPEQHRCDVGPGRFTHNTDAPGTARRCDCGATWVAFRLARPVAGQMFAPGFDIRCQREGRMARWLRERKAER